ncbi:hypothetical protein [Alcaligenes faecalis]|uniref:hypothetical protein n=1 Tax=Alcaligenes faecalis TaxID=511 RepID=UPI000F0AF64E|nr:hypothetical protein [Alcaligenes faecalis]AYR19263.1 hypothetical protein D6I95_02115 [Alcaligenes faecalis]
MPGLPLDTTIDQAAFAVNAILKSLQALVEKQIVEIAYYTCLIGKVSKGRRAAKATHQVKEEVEITRKYLVSITK